MFRSLHAPVDRDWSASTGQYQTKRFSGIQRCAQGTFYGAHFLHSFELLRVSHQLQYFDSPVPAMSDGKRSPRAVSGLPQRLANIGPPSGRAFSQAPLVSLGLHRAGSTSRVARILHAH
jgi:hypothetical protein